jgi:ASPM-SPD-2-Hydin domain-containing protein/HYDIN/CFA65/VesB family protein
MKRTFADNRYARRTVMMFFFSLMVWLTAVMNAGIAWAHASGMNGYSGNPATHSGSICSACHGGGSAPTVGLTGPTSLAPGSSGVYTLMITGGAAVVGGLDVSTSAGTLQASGPGTKLQSGDITQTAATPFTSGALSFTFTLVAPSTVGQLTLYAAGLSANGNGGTSGDNAAATTLAVTVAVPSVPQITVTDSVAPTNDLQIPFGTISDGLTYDQTVTVGNSGSADLVLGTIAGANPIAAPFTITADNCSGHAIAPAATCTVTVRFAPTSATSFNDSFDIPSNDSNTATVVISVSGTGSTTPVPHIVVTDSVAPNNDLSIPFGDVAQGATSDQTVTVTNGGNANLVIGTIAGANPLAAPFTITADHCSGQAIAPAATCTVAVRFAPTSAGALSDAFDIPSNDPGTPSVLVSVSGTGVAASTNNATTAPVLVSPADGETGVGATTSFQWTKSTDPAGDAITYHLYYCADSTFAACAPENVASSGMTGVYFAGSGLVFFGFVLTRSGRGRKFMLTLMIALLVMTGSVMLSCGGGGSAAQEGTQASTDITHQVSGLNSATTYYWKVIADNGKGGLASSATWSFTTQ